MEKSKSYFEETSWASKSTLESFYRKRDLIKNNVDLLDNLIDDVLTNGLYEEDRYIDNELICSAFANYCELTYSCMEYIGYILYIYQKRTNMVFGTRKGTQASFHKIVDVCVNLKGDHNYIIYKHNGFSTIVKDISLWYLELREIRAKETHYNSGKIKFKNNSVFYVNEVEYGKDLPEREFDLSLTKAYFNRFIKSTDALISMINNYEIKVD